MNPYVYPGIRDTGDITCLVAGMLGFTIEELQARRKSRKRPYVEARQIIVYFLNRYGMTLGAAGMVFKKDHATVLHSIRAVRNMYDTNKDFAHMIDKIDMRVLTIKNHNNDTEQQRTADLLV